MLLSDHRAVKAAVSASPGHVLSSEDPPVSKLSLEAGRWYPLDFSER